MVEFKCTGCGSKLEIEEELAGNKIKCPECGKTLEVPGTNVRPLSFLCNNCGADLQVDAYSAGKLVNCVHCGCMVAVPRLEGDEVKSGCMGLVALCSLLLAVACLLALER